MPHARRETGSKEARNTKVAAVQAAAYESIRAMEPFAGVDDPTVRNNPHTRTCVYTRTLS